MSKVLRNRCYDEIKPGDSAGLHHTLTERDVQLFATVTGNFNPLHQVVPNADTRAAMPCSWLNAQVAGLLGTELPGPGATIDSQDLKFMAAAYVGDTVEIRISAKTKLLDNRVVFSCQCKNQDDQTLMPGEVVVVAPTQSITINQPAKKAVSIQTHHAFEVLLQRCEGLPPAPVVVAWPCEPVSLMAAVDAAKRKLMQPTLVGPEKTIRTIAEMNKLSLDGLRIEDVSESRAAAARAVELVAQMPNAVLMKGSLHTDELMSAVVKSPLRTYRRISHVFIMDVPTYHKPLYVTDAAINIYPDFAAKVDICQNAIDLAIRLGVKEPRVAILSAMETVNPKVEATMEAAVLCKMADRGQIARAILDGPLAFDNAISEQAARIKRIVSHVAGNADILLVPDLEAGNILAKELTFMSNADADSAGILLGAQVPIILTSRADSERTRLASCAIACLLAHRADTMEAE